MKMITLSRERLKAIIIESCGQGGMRISKSIIEDILDGAKGKG